MKKFRNKIIAFDIGNVLCTVDLDPFYNLMVEKGLVETIDSAKHFMDGIQGPQDVGLYSMTQALRRFFPKIDGKTVGELYEAWMYSVNFSQPMVEFVEELLEENCHIALLSNIGVDHAEVVRKQNFTNHCVQHFSYEIGARKPTALFFQSFLMEHNKWCNELFFDDNADNINSAKIFGKLNGVQFSLLDFPGHEQAVLEVKRVLST